MTRPVPAARRSAHWGSVLVLVLVGMLLGGGAGLAMGSSGPTIHLATALVQLGPVTVPALASLQGTQQSEQEQAQYVSGELAFLSGEGLKRTLRERLDAGPVDFAAVQEAQSSVVRLTATSTSQDEAVRILETALTVYSERRAEQSEQRTRDALAAVDRALNEANSPGRISDPGTAARIDRLENLRLDVLLQGGDGTLDIIEPPAPAEQEDAPRWLLPTVMGAVVGGLLAALFLIARRALSGRVQTVDDVQDAVDRVLQPEVLLRRRDGAKVAGLGKQTAADRRLGRLLAAQLFGGQPIAGRVVVVAGASRHSGTTTVASLIAAGAADHGSTLLIRIRFPVTPRSGPSDESRVLPDGSLITKAESDRLQIIEVPPELPGFEIGGKRFRDLITASQSANPCVVLDAGAITDSPELLRSLRAAVDVVVVLRIGADDLSEAAGIVAAVGTGTGQVAAVLTRRSLPASLGGGLRG